MDLNHTVSHRIQWLRRALAAGALLCISALAAEAPFPPAPQWQNLGAVDIVPCPKKIELRGAAMRVAGMALLYVPDVDERTATGAAEIASRVMDLGGVSLAPTPVSNPMAALSATSGAAIIVGYGRETCPLPDAEHAFVGVSAWDQDQGYIIASRRQHGHRAVVVWGREPLGALYGCVTLRHLVAREDDGVVLRVADVVDWPDFKWRVTSGFFGSRSSKPEDIAAAAETAHGYIRRAALLKCNAITPTRHWSVRARPDYLSEVDLELLERLTPYARSYGVRFFIQHSTAVGTRERDKDDPRYAQVPNLRGWYMSWSHEELIDLSMARFAAEARRLGSNADWFFHYPDVHEGGWPQRSAACRERWGDDHAAADAYFGNRLHQALKSASASSRISLCLYPYGLDLDLPGNTRSMQYFDKVSALLPADVLLTRREGSRRAYQSWWRHIRQPLAVWWSPRTFWGARALAPDMAFVKTAWRGSALDLAADCLTVHSRPVLDVSGYTFAEYTWNVAAPGSGVWHADPSQVRTVPLSTPGDCYVFEAIPAPDGSAPWSDWVYLQGRHEPRPFCYDLVQRCCRLIYGPAAAPAMAESLRYAPLVQESKWSSDPVIAAALAESAERSFQALAPLWGKRELFQTAPGSGVSTYGVYTQMVKVNADLRAVLAVRAAKLTADARLQEARDANTPQLRHTAAAAAAECARRGLSLLETKREELRAAYARYELEGKSWYLLLAAGFRKCEEVERKLDSYAGGFQLVREEAETVLAAPASGERRRELLLSATSAAVSVDGDPAEWALLSPIVINLDSGSEHAGERPSSNADSSAICYLAWDKTYLYVLAKVVDDDALCSGDGAAVTGDAFCLWVNGNGFVAGPGSDGVARLETVSGIPPVDAQTAIRRVAAHDLARDVALLADSPEGMDGQPGYTVEIRLPWEPMRIRPAQGRTCWLALGVRDLDDEQQAVALVLPATYRPLTAGGRLTDFAQTTLTGEPPIRVELLGLRKEDRTMQLGTDSIVHAAIEIESPVDLTDVCVRFTAPADDGRVLASGVVPGVPGRLRHGRSWRSEPFELNAGPARKRVVLEFIVTANETGLRVKADIE